MSNLVSFSNANLPAVSSLSTALRSLEKDIGPSGVVLLKMDKTGHWVFGADQTEVEDHHATGRRGVLRCDPQSGRERTD